MKKFSLLIDPSRDKSLTLILFNGQRQVSRQTYNFSRGHGDIFGGVIRFLKSKKKSWMVIKELGVINGDGSFTATRLAVSLANTLAWILDLPVKSIPTTLMAAKFFSADSRQKEGRFKNFIKPLYRAAPNIIIK